METYLTAKEVAALMRLSLATIRRYTMKNQIPYHRINRTVRYKKTEIEQWVESGDLFNAGESGDEKHDG